MKSLTLKHVVTNLSRNLSTRPSVRIVEVGPRDGLQNEKEIVPTTTKIEFINKLSKTGLRTIEVTSFVSPKWVPQMADNAKVFKQISKSELIAYPVLVPNERGLEAALQVGVTEIAVMASASDSFSQKNVNCSAAEAINRVKQLIEKVKLNRLKIRGYISCAVGCPYEGPIKPLAVSKTAEALMDLGCYEISLGDTIGVGTPGTVQSMLKETLKVILPSQAAIHCHDTYGQGLVNIYTALDMGVEVVDASVSGLGGCPYAKGASGNIATEDVVYMLNGMGVNTGIDLQKLMEAGDYICKSLNKKSESKVHKALYKSAS